jgi:hypothetical protein
MSGRERGTDTSGEVRCGWWRSTGSWGKTLGGYAAGGAAYDRWWQSSIACGWGRVAGSVRDTGSYAASALPKWRKNPARPNPFDLSGAAVPERSHHVHRPVARAAALLLVLLSTGGPQHSSRRPIVDTPTLLAHGIPVTRDGDIILRRGQTWISSTVMALDKRAGYSHAGIVVFLDDTAHVVHVEPGGVDGAGHVVIESLTDFLRAGRASAFALYRLREHLQDAVPAALEAARSYAAARLPFDERFDVDDPSRFYCTELVWRAFRNAGVDIVPEFRHRPAPAWGGPPLILISDLQTSELLERVGEGEWPSGPPLTAYHTH